MHYNFVLISKDVIDQYCSINEQQNLMFENMSSCWQQKKQCVKVAYEGKAATMPE